MSISVASVSNSTWGSQKIGATKPTGLAVGDLMVCVFAISEASPARTLVTGWTSLRVTTNIPSGNGIYLETAYKVADADDVALSVIEVSTGDHYSASCLMRIENAFPVFVDNGATLDNTSSPASFANTITPSKVGSLIILGFASQAGNNIASGWTYAVTTSSPAFTERFAGNDGGGGGANHQFNCATAIRPEVSATGNAIITAETSATTDWVGQQVSIKERSDATISPADTTAPADVISAIRARVANTSETQASSDSILASIAIVWRRVAKSAISIWNNEQK